MLNLDLCYYLLRRGAVLWLRSLYGSGAHCAFFVLIITCIVSETSGLDCNGDVLQQKRDTYWRTSTLCGLSGGGFRYSPHCWRSVGVLDILKVGFPVLSV